MGLYTHTHTHTNSLKKEKGITLIALVITIIVLLILAGVSIATLTGDNGILTRANDSKTQTEIGEEKEAIGLAYNGVMADNLGDGVSAWNLQDELISNGYNVTASESNTITVKFNDSQRVYTIDNNGNISYGGGEVIPPEGNLPSTPETAPFLPDGATPTNTDWDTGITIKDSNNNEWVWIVVPKSITATSTTDDEIKNALIGYATEYRDTSYSDTSYSGCGLEEGEYAQKYSTLLQSIKQYGGFYIGKYEVGSFDIPVTSKDNTRKPVIQQGAYPYNYVECQQAENLAEGLATGGRTSTLMFGIQWDLVLKYLEINENWDTTNEASYYLKTNSNSWGNYSDATFSVKDESKHAILNQSTGQLGDWSIVPENYIKPNPGTESWVLLSTGASEKNKKMNIYDLAGNLYEWTLEKSITSGRPCVYRGGNYNFNGSIRPASIRGGDVISLSISNVGFRCALY